MLFDTTFCQELFDEAGNSENPSANLSAMRMPRFKEKHTAVVLWTGH